ncbi:hypothetical protein PAHAL_7G111900 [Panicum hallii]|uniref:Enoyl reductase (ER) domain-containing protein n=1 Tax=Panicum hallii TaxID=206008 RepID=A0A2T8IBT4_9POAL|nr:chloroplast envelope quinone oxidoreductase homolog isoform X2 [Panicum hallii]PVH35141.1 hypothetical protein PAHAL_7G111900 [Panicum hallii]
MATGGRPTTMRAIQYTGYGGGAASLKYVEIPVPLLGKNEVLVKVEAASINPADWKIQKGMLRPFLPKFPCIPVTDVAGEVAEVGSSVREFKVADKVLCRLKFGKGGGLAEYVVAYESKIAARPAGVSAADAAGLPISGLTALQALMSIGTKFDGTGRGADILVTAASGGVGMYAVQLAKLGNHHVTATCGARNMEVVRALGADEVLDYKTPEGQALTSPSGRKYDYVINTTDASRWSALRPSLSGRGSVVDVTPNPGNYIASVLTMFARKKISMLAQVSLGKEHMRFLLELVAEGKLRTVVDSRHPFEKAAEAWERSMAGHATGKIIVEM